MILKDWYHSLIDLGLADYTVADSANKHHHAQLSIFWLTKVQLRRWKMERRSSVDLENVASSKEISPESPPSANVDSSSAAETKPRTPDNQIATLSSASPSGSAIIVVDTSSTDSGYVEANSSADSTQAQVGGGSLDSSPSSGDAVERFVYHWRWKYYSIRSH